MMLDRVARAARALMPSPAPEPAIGASIVEVLASIEAQDFVDEAAGPAAPDRFSLLSGACTAALVRERRAFEQLAALDAIPRAHGRSQGLEYALDEAWHALDRLRQVRDLLAALAPVEDQVRALLAAREEVLS